MITLFFILFLVCASIIFIISYRRSVKNRSTHNQGENYRKLEKKVYYSSMEEAVSNRKLSLDQADYQRELGTIIKRTDGKNYTSVLCHMVEANKKAETLAYIKFQVRLVGGKKRYAFYSIDTSSTIYYQKSADRVERSVSFIHTTGLQAAMAMRYQLSKELPIGDESESEEPMEQLEYDKRNMSVIPGKQFFYYLTQDDSINSLTIHHQKPDEIIIIQSAVYPAKPWYFVYYTDVGYKGDIMDVSIKIDEK